MTALTKYDRLEAAGLWRAAPDQQRVDVVVCIGDATLTIKDMRDQALAHWSLAAIARANPGKRPALFHPEGDSTETLEIAADEDEMIRAIEKLRKAVERARPHKGRLRGFLTAGILAAGLAAAVVLLPDAPAPDVVDRKVGRPAGAKNKGSSQMRDWLAARGYRLPEEVLVEMAGMATTQDVFTWAMVQAERQSFADSARLTLRAPGHRPCGTGARSARRALGHG